MTLAKAQKMLAKFCWDLRKSQCPAANGLVRTPNFQRSEAVMVVAMRHANSQPPEPIPWPPRPSDLRGASENGKRRWVCRFRCFNSPSCPGFFCSFPESILKGPFWNGPNPWPDRRALVEIAMFKLKFQSKASWLFKSLQNNPQFNPWQRPKRATQPINAWYCAVESLAYLHWMHNKHRTNHYTYIYLKSQNIDVHSWKMLEAHSYQQCHYHVKTCQQITVHWLVDMAESCCIQRDSAGHCRFIWAHPLDGYFWTQELWHKTSKLDAKPSMNILRVSWYE